jgi:outer membrane protein assembly factor BamB
LGVAAAIATFGSIGRSRPAEAPSARITPANVRSLREVWRAPLAHRAAIVAVADGVVLAVTDPEDLPNGIEPEVSAYPVACDASCAPLWHAPVDAPGLAPAGPLVRDGVVYVAGADLSAFPLHCRTDGGVCTPLWRAAVPGGATQPVADDANVYVGSMDGRVYGFPLDCSPPHGRCSARWVSRPQHLPLLASEVVDGRLLVSVAATGNLPHLNRLFAFDASCSTPCAPSEVGDVPGQRFVSMPVVSDGVMYVGTAVNGGEGALMAYDVACGLSPSCRLWSLEEHEALNIPRPVVGDGAVVTAARFTTHRIRAYVAGAEETDDPVWTACCVFDISDALPVIEDGLVYVPSLTGGVAVYPVACRTPFCEPVWEWPGTRPLGSAGATALAVGDGVLIAADRADGLVAFAPAGPRHVLSSGERTMTATFYLLLAAVLIGLFVRRRRVTEAGTIPAASEPERPPIRTPH